MIIEVGDWVPEKEEGVLLAVERVVAEEMEPVVGEEGLVMEEESIVEESNKLPLTVGEPLKVEVPLIVGELLVVDDPLVVEGPLDVEKDPVIMEDPFVLPVAVEDPLDKGADDDKVDPSVVDNTTVVDDADPLVAEGELDLEDERAFELLESPLEVEDARLEAVDVELSTKVLIMDELIVERILEFV